MTTISIPARCLFWCAIAALAAMCPTRAAAFHSDFDDDFGWTLLQMQREAISSQEERAREAGRERRRDEVEQLRQQQADEHEEYFQSILEASQASLRAPRGAYYRRPGESTPEMPPSAQPVEIGGVGYLYDQGIFWLTPGPPFIVVAAPTGAVVERLPAGAYRILGQGQDAPRYYYFGTFFQEQDGRFAVVKPPPGTHVSYLPDGYRTEQRNGTTLYSFGSVHYKPVFVQGVLMYHVVEP